MIRLWVAPPPYIAELVAMLAEQRIATRVLDEATVIAHGGFPFRWPRAEIWIENDADLPLAQAILQRYFEQRAADRKAAAPWRCPRCHELIDGQFTECWNCLVQDAGDDPRRNPDARCEECGYILWGLPQRRCPECGADF